MDGDQAFIIYTKQESHITCVQSCMQPAERIVFLGIHMQNNWLVLCVTCMYSVTRLYAETHVCVCVCVCVEHTTLLKLHTKNNRIVKNKPIGMTTT